MECLASLRCAEGDRLYEHCIFCATRLGRNETIEPFPLGRRLAFDPRRGRLWVVCSRCQRWNLSPIEERWEAFEACERAFRNTVVRVSTENIGLARLPDGLDLIRIGEPLRPEFAAWRYAPQLRRRRASAVIAGMSVAGGVTGLVLTSPLIALTSLAWPLYSLRLSGKSPRKTSPGRVVSNMGETLEISPVDWGSPRLRPGGGHEGSWQLEVEHGPFIPLDAADDRSLHAPGLQRSRLHLTRKSAVLTGREAEHALALLLPHLNPLGAGRRQVRTAVAGIEANRGPERYFAAAEAHARNLGIGEYSIARLPLAVRLGLEIAANEESERRAMDGELVLLERAWRDAEEIAALADSLLAPDLDPA